MAEDDVPGELIDRLRRMSDRAGIFLDFDGTLSPIAPRPELARALPGVPDLLVRLAKRYAVVALISGRPAQELADLVPVSEVRLLGLYGWQDTRGSDRIEGLPPAAREQLAGVASSIPGVRLEDKGLTVALHYREAPRPDEVAARLEAGLAPLVAGLDAQVLRGKMVLEIVPRGMPQKGAAVLREVRAAGLTACLYAGDDLADLDAFAALDALVREGLLAIKVAVRSEGTPTPVADQADITVAGPEGLVGLLKRLAR